MGSDCFSDHFSPSNQGKIPMSADIINKIKALLSKTTEAGCTEAESQAAVAMANKLITQYNIALDDIKGSESGLDKEKWGEAKVIESGKYTLDISLAVDVVESYFFVQSIMFRKPTSRKGIGFKLCFYGTQSNVVTAKYVFDGLIFAFDNLWKKYKIVTCCPNEYKRIFICKVAEGFKDKLKIERYTVTQEMDAKKGAPGSTALAIRNIHETTIAKYKQTYPNVKSTNINFAQIQANDRVARDGYEAGRKLNINRPIGESKRKSIN